MTTATKAHHAGRTFLGIRVFRALRRSWAEIGKPERVGQGVGSGSGLLGHRSESRTAWMREKRWLSSK